MARQRLRRETRDLLLSDDLAALEVRAAVVCAERDELEALLIAAENRVDRAGYDRIEAAFELADDEHCAIERRIDELEEDASFRAMQEMRREYWGEIFR